MRLLPRTSGFALTVVLSISCGGETNDDAQNTAQHPTPGATGGLPSTGDPNAAGGSVATGGAATGGYAGCANRSVMYDEDTVFEFDTRGIAYLPECIPTCNQRASSIASVPAGSCSSDPDCVMMFTGGFTRYYFCSCVNSAWSCFSVSGAP